MNLPQWITLIAGSLTVLVVIYWAAAMIWIHTADLYADEPWWLRGLARFIEKHFP